MVKPYVPPTLDNASYNCPQCGSYAQHFWKHLSVPIVGNDEEISENYAVSSCNACENVALWKYDKLVYPTEAVGPLPNDDMPDNVKEIYLEARGVSGSSPRASAALLRLAIQELMTHFGQKSGELNTDIGALVKDGLPQQIQKALDSVRVVGNNAVHPGVIDLKDNRELAAKLFHIINVIVETLITNRKHVEEVYGMLTEGQKKQISKRDKKS